MKEERVKILTDNEQYIKDEEEKRLKGAKSDDEDEDNEGFVDEDKSDDDDIEDNEDE